MDPVDSDSVFQGQRDGFLGRKVRPAGVIGDWGGGIPEAMLSGSRR